MRRPRRSPPKRRRSRRGWLRSIAGCDCLRSTGSLLLPQPGAALASAVNNAVTCHRFMLTSRLILAMSVGVAWDPSPLSTHSIPSGSLGMPARRARGTRCWDDLSRSRARSPRIHPKPRAQRATANAAARSSCRRPSGTSRSSSPNSSSASRGCRSRSARSTSRSARSSSSSEKLVPSPRLVSAAAVSKQVPWALPSSVPAKREPHRVRALASMGLRALHRRRPRSRHRSARSRPMWPAGLSAQPRPDATSTNSPAPREIRCRSRSRPQVL